MNLEPGHAMHYANARVAAIDGYQITLYSTSDDEAKSIWDFVQTVPGFSRVKVERLPIMEKPYMFEIFVANDQDLAWIKLKYQNLIVVSKNACTN